MKLLTFQIGAENYLGALDDGGVVNLTQAAPGNSDLSSMQALIEGGSAALDAACEAMATTEQRLDLADLTLLAPLPVPVQVRDCLSFEEHLKNSFKASLKVQAMSADDPVAAEAALRKSGRFNVPKVWYEQPIYYKCNRFAVGAPYSDVHWPAYSQLMDFELEMACVIGKQGKDIARDDVEDHIFGYTIYNDFSARDAQSREIGGMLGPAKGKDFDNSTILGPVIVTKDELPDPYALSMRAKINGEIWCDGNSATMHWQFPDMIAHISQGETLNPGEVIGSGTVGWGCGLEHMRFLKDQDVVELEIEGIGITRNRVIASSNG